MCKEEIISISKKERSDGMKVIYYQKKDSPVLFEGTETECREWIISQASEHIKYTGRDGKEHMLIRVLDDPDGKAYDVGRCYMYQIIR